MFKDLILEENKPEKSEGIITSLEKFLATKDYNHLFKARKDYSNLPEREKHQITLAMAQADLFGPCGIDVIMAFEGVAIMSITPD